METTHTDDCPKPKRTFLKSLDGVTIALYGQASGDWSTRSWEPDTSVELRNNLPTYQRLSRIGEKFGAQSIYFPRPDKFNGKIDASCLNAESDTLPTADKWHKIRTNGSKTTILRGPLVDGAIFGPGQGFFINSADCPTIVARYLGMTIATHAGRECLYDKCLAQTGKKTEGREHESVVFAIVDTFKQLATKRGVTFNPNGIHVFITCGIAGKNFEHRLDHPNFGPANRRMIPHLLQSFPTLPGYPHVLKPFEAGMISLHNLARAQLHMCGVPEMNVSSDGINTYDDIVPSRAHTKNRKFIWHSYRRYEEECALECAQSGMDPYSFSSPECRYRNGVLVVSR